MNDDMGEAVQAPADVALGVRSALAALRRLGAAPAPSPKADPYPWVGMPGGYEPPPAAMSDLAPVAWSGAPERAVPVADLVATQASVRPDRVERFVRHPEAYARPPRHRGPGAPRAAETMKVAEVGGRMFVHDGHHRLAAARLRGDPEVWCAVIVPPPAHVDGNGNISGQTLAGAAFARAPRTPSGADAVRITSDMLETRAAIDAASVVSRIEDAVIAEADRLFRQGLSPGEVADQMLAYLGTLSSKSLGAAGRQAVNAAHNLGRNLETQLQAGEVAFVVRTAVLDKATCGPCAGLDGRKYEVDSPAYWRNMPPAQCEGLDNCRCFYLDVFGVGAPTGTPTLGPEPADVAAGFDESKHPREPGGSEKGGEFAPKDGGGSGARSSVLGDGTGRAPDGSSASWSPTQGGTLFHGTGTPALKFGSAYVYLTDDYDEAVGYAAGLHLGGTGKTPSVLTVDAAPGRVEDVSAAVNDEVMNGVGDIDHIFGAARARGARYATYEHPRFSSKRGAGEQRVFVSLHPGEDLRRTGGWRIKEALAKLGPDDPVVLAWDEAAHPRGETTDASTPGSFAPAGGSGSQGPGNLIAHRPYGETAKNHGPSGMKIYDTDLNTTDEQIEKAKDHVGVFMSGVLSKRGVDIEERDAEFSKLTAETERRAQDMLSRASVAMAVPLDVIFDKIMGSGLRGEFENQFQTGTSMGLLSERSRAANEHNQFGIETDRSGEGRPRYGFMLDEHVMPDNLNVLDASSYGEVIVVFKPEVRARTTVTFGDSMQRSGMPSPVDGVRWWSTLNLVKESNVKNVNEYPSYVEAQIHGRLTLNHVDHVWLRYRLSANAEQVLRLKKLGIEVRYGIAK